MEGFKQNPKMKSDIACYKEGGSVYKSRTHKEDPSEAAEDKAMVKKGIRQHESAKHKGEDKTEIKLKQGGRAKKEKGTVKKYKTGGGVNASEKGKPSGDKDKTKKVTADPKKAAAPSAANKKETNEIPGYAFGGDVLDVMDNVSNAVEGVPKDYGTYNPDLSAPRFDQTETPMAENVFTATASPAITPGRRPPIDREQFMAAKQAAKQQRLAEKMARKQRRFDEKQQKIESRPDFGMKNGLNTGPMGNANPMGAAKAANPTDVMRGIQAIGEFCRGGQT